MEGQDQAPISSPSISPAPPVNTDATLQPRNNNLRHIIIVIILSILGLAVAGAIIYFTLHVTGVIKTISQNSDSTTSEEETDSAELASLLERIDAIRKDSSIEDESLEQDLKNYAGKMINEHGNDSQEAYDAAMALVSYYDLRGMYDEAKAYLEDRISVSEDSDNNIKYEAEIYRLAVEYGDEATSNNYLEQVNSETNPKVKSAELQAIAYQLLIDLFRKNGNQDDYSACEDHISEIRKYADQAEEAYPSGDTAYLLATIEDLCGNEEKAQEYLKIAAERDPGKYTMVQEGGNSDGQ